MHPFKITTFLALGSALLLALFTQGCTHYQAGHPGEISYTNLYVAPIRSNAYVPQAQAPLATQLKELLLKDGRFHIAASEQDADATLRVTLVNFDRGVSATSVEDTGRGESFDLQLVANIELVDNTTHRRVISDKEVSAVVSTTATGGLQGAEYQSMPVLTRELARKIRDTIVNPW